MMNSSLVLLFSEKKAREQGLEKKDKKKTQDKKLGNSFLFDSRKG